MSKQQREIQITLVQRFPCENTEQAKGNMDCGACTLHQAITSTFSIIDRKNLGKDKSFTHKQQRPATSYKLKKIVFTQVISVCVAGVLMINMTPLYSYQIIKLTK